MIQKNKKRKIGTIIFWSIVAILYLLAEILEAVCDWFNLRFGVSFEEILFTLASPLEGSDISFLDEAVEYVIPTGIEAAVTIAVVVALVVAFRKVSCQISLVIKTITIKIQAYTIYKLGCLLIAVLLLANTISYGVESLSLDDYISKRMQSTTIYEDYYVEPTADVITLNGEPKNIIYLYLESMETTYASVADGGAQEINYIPKLTQLAKENVSFSDTELLGGGYWTPGATWTMGALFASTSGVPFSFAVEGNSMNSHQKFAPGITTLGDVLNEYGYNQVFLCGSDGTFAGRQKYFEQHGNYEVKDYYYAVDKGYIEEDYFVWWGYEDAKLYEIAKLELLELAQKDEPFNFTMLTVDTHHVDGYVCSNCSDTYSNQLEKVLECADNLAAEFIAWCQQQDFYEDTVIVITGDHFRMDSTLVADKERRVYNCYINANCEATGETTNRTFNTMDFFPTTLAAMGFEIKGDRLSLGTNLFSDTPTLAEELGLDYFRTEIRKYSEYYHKNFE